MHGAGTYIYFDFWSYGEKYVFTILKEKLVNEMEKKFYNFFHLPDILILAAKCVERNIIFRYCIVSIENIP